ncbi:YafY family protein [Oceanispirochaeta sp.]|jgi:predicted DNA-binding transcriptional regulator YafY|uniref:helix-turn-helix transcriptional regulator n=1 Tax=Oceanispirochaeta sp. TaxID=2035350 RepID=UPI0026219E9B|nr:WYL domain-containing protein [Oceanispirochaeta sp.]MDA3955287.1 WYL domain-containing protein [Oceanispirochaeta sp.]
MAAAKNLIQFMKAFELLSRPGGISIKELQEKLGLSRRSVYRLFESMEELGYPLVDRPLDGKTKNWGLMEEYITSRPSGRIPRLSLNTKETMILYQILSRQTPLYESGMKQTIGALRNRLEQFYLENTRAGKVERFKDIFVSIPGQYKHLDGKEIIYETLLQAALDQKICRGVYRSFRLQEDREMEFTVLCFFEWNYGLYCFIRRREDGELRTMALERFVSAVLTDIPGGKEKDFHPEALLEQAWALNTDDPLEVKIHFSPSAAPYIKEREWSSSQKIELHIDGSLTLSMKTSGRRDIKSWVQSFGKEAFLLEPKDLKKELQKELEEQISGYKESTL